MLTVVPDARVEWLLGTGPAGLLDIVSGRSKAVFTTWLQAQSAAFRAGIETVAMDGFTDYKSAAEALSDAVAAIGSCYGDVLVTATWGSSGLVVGVNPLPRSG